MVPFSGIAGCSTQQWKRARTTCIWDNGPERAHNGCFALSKKRNRQREFHLHKRSIPVQKEGRGAWIQTFLPFALYSLWRFRHIPSLQASVSPRYERTMLSPTHRKEGTSGSVSPTFLSLSLDLMKIAFPYTSLFSFKINKIYLLCYNLAYDTSKCI